MRSPILTLLCVVPLSASPLAAADTLSLAPSSKWVLEYEKERCRIGRFFGEGDERTVLFFEQYAPDSELRWIVAGKPLKTLQKNSQASWRYGSTGEWTPLSVRGMSLDGHGNALASDGEVETHRTDRPQPAIDDNGRERGLPRLDSDRVDGLASLEIDAPRVGTIALETGQLAPLYRSMNACMDDLVASWGVDMERQAERAVAPRLTNAPVIERILIDKYPQRALRNGEQADLHLRIMVDDKGAVTDCVVTNMTVAESFGDAACTDVKKRAIFEPAMDEAGHPMASFYTTRLRYTMRAGPDYTWPGQS